MQTSYTIARDEIYDVDDRASVIIKDACGATNFTPEWTRTAKTRPTGRHRSATR